MTLIAHDINGTTYYACDECGACPCPKHNSEHTLECSHRVPDEWNNEDCAMGPGRFMICSRCQVPPCHGWDCICTAQGGAPYSSGCPIHDNTVDTMNPHWRKMYYDHQEAQRKIKERLGW